MSFERGSEWRKWDIHIHTPGTAKNDHYGSDSWDSYISKLESLSDIDAFGITDYCSLRNYYKVKRFQDSGRLGGKFIFPNIEFRILPVTGRNVPVNLHILIDPALTREEIERELLSCITLEACGKTFHCVDSDLISLGREVCAGVSDEDSLWRKGVEQFVVDYSKIRAVLSKAAIRKHVLVGVANGSGDGNSGLRDSSLLTNRQEIYRMSDIIFSANESDVEYFLGKGGDSVEKVIEKYGGLKPCVRGSDAHKLDSVGVFPGNRAAWIKGDLTFEGLRQITFEPYARVRIQDESPEYEYDKTPFSSIVIEEDTPCFTSQDDDVYFKKANIPLNTGLVSIIGGRGSGKSMLVSYMGAGLGKTGQQDLNSKAPTVVVGHRRSISDGEIAYRLSESPQVPYMFISQGQVAKLINDREALNRNIRETIGISQAYSVPTEVRDMAERCINQFYSCVKILGEGGTTYEQKVVALNENIHRNRAFIKSVTSEANKKRIEVYTQKVAARKKLAGIRDDLNALKASIIESIDSVNEEIKRVNSDYFAKHPTYAIPLASYSEAVKKIDETIMPALEAKDKEHATSIQDVREQFKEYKGDISTLLFSVQGYKDQELVNERQLAALNDEKRKFEGLSRDGFKKVGEKIRESVVAYKKAIDDQWVRFKTGIGSDVLERQELVKKILDEHQLNVRVELGIDLNALVEELYSGHRLDGRKYKKDKILDLIRIHSIDDYFVFICQETEWHIFNGEIEDDLRGRLIEVFFKKFPAFVRHDIIVEANGRPLNKLSHGQQGTVYLRLQIAANLFSETIVYDQPEDDLDNQFIMNELVDLFREIKRYRQVIIVSHNANLVVNADSDQVIVASNDGGCLSYKTGSLENPEIQKMVCDILEGGRDAFARRGNRYRSC